MSFDLTADKEEYEFQPGDLKRGGEHGLIDAGKNPDKNVQPVRDLIRQAALGYQAKDDTAGDAKYKEAVKAFGDLKQTPAGDVLLALLVLLGLQTVYTGKPAFGHDLLADALAGLTWGLSADVVSSKLSGLPKR